MKHLFFIITALSVSSQILCAATTDTRKAILQRLRNINCSQSKQQTVVPVPSPIHIPGSQRQDPPTEDHIYSLLEVCDGIARELRARNKEEGARHRTAFIFPDTSNTISTHDILPGSNQTRPELIPTLMSKTIEVSYAMRHHNLEHVMFLVCFPNDDVVVVHNPAYTNHIFRR